MRRTRARRRFKTVLGALLVVCVMLFFESRIEAFVPDIKSLAVSNLEETLGGRFRISIGSIDGGILHPFIFNDIKIVGEKDMASLASLEIASVRTNCRIWDALLRRNTSGLAADLFRAYPEVCVNFATRHKEVEGFVVLRGDVTDLSMKGYLAIFDKGKVDFAGSLKKNSFDIELRPQGLQGSIRAEGSISEEGVIIANLKVNHIKFYGLDIVCDLYLKDKIALASGLPGEGYVEGTLEAKNLIVNYRPFLNLRTSYRISGGMLELVDLSLGDNLVRASGKAALRQPYNIDIAVVANNVNLGWILSSLGFGEAVSILSGTMNGKFNLKGPIKGLKSTAHIELKNGTMSTMGFDFLSANFKGDGPFVRIEDSRITRQSGYFVLAGEMDMRKIGKGNMFDNLKLVTDDKAINWDGWNASTLVDTQEVRMKKKLNDTLNLDFKKVISDRNIDEGSRDNDEVRLEYKLDGNDSLRVMVGQDKDFFGLEHKDRF